MVLTLILSLSICVVSPVSLFPPLDKAPAYYNIWYEGDAQKRFVDWKNGRKNKAIPITVCWIRLESDL